MLLSAVGLTLPPRLLVRAWLCSGSLPVQPVWCIHAMGGRLHWGQSQFGAGRGLGCSEEELVKGNWMVISPLLAVAGRGGHCPPWEQGDAGSRAGQGAGIISALAQAVVPIRQLGEGDGMAGLSPGKAYEITYVRLKFHTSRPESFAIYKRSRAEGPWVPFQYYSASCEKTYGKRQRHYLRPGEDEQVAFCTDEFSDISPLSGGNVAFSTLEGRPSAYNFDGSPALQVPLEWEVGGCMVPRGRGH